ncbi:MAG: SDR family NAD(P)-dependent oxidoreductase, partial [Burkholderiales bacterium]
MRLQGKSAIVTGSGSGLGRAMIQRLAEEGASVVIADANEQAMNRAVSELTAAGHKAIGVRVDVTRR